MKRIALLTIPLIAIGCTPTSYRKTVTVTKDGNGKVESIKVEEEVLQNYDDFKLDPKWMDQ